MHEREIPYGVGCGLDRFLVTGRLCLVRAGLVRARHRGSGESVQGGEGGHAGGGGGV